MKLDIIVIVLAVTAATFQTGYLLADTNRADTPATHAPASDSVITTQIKSAYRLEPVLGDTRVSIRTSHGNVRLAGLVDSEEAAAKAEDIASRVEGVREVRSHIHVINAGHGESVTASML